MTSKFIFKIIYAHLILLIVLCVWFTFFSPLSFSANSDSKRMMGLTGIFEAQFKDIECINGKNLLKKSEDFRAEIHFDTMSNRFEGGVFFRYYPSAKKCFWVTEMKLVAETKVKLVQVRPFRSPLVCAEELKGYVVEEEFDPETFNVSMEIPKWEEIKLVKDGFELSREVEPGSDSVCSGGIKRVKYKRIK